MRKMNKNTILPILMAIFMCFAYCISSVWANEEEPIQIEETVSQEDEQVSEETGDEISFEFNEEELNTSDQDLIMEFDVPDDYTNENSELVYEEDERYEIKSYSIDSNKLVITVGLKNQNNTLLMNSTYHTYKIYLAKKQIGTVIMQEDPSVNTDSNTESNIVEQELQSYYDNFFKTNEDTSDSSVEQVDVVEVTPQETTVKQQSSKHTHGVSSTIKESNVFLVVVMALSGAIVVFSLRKKKA